MSNLQYYPTPQKLARYMLSKIKYFSGIKYVLEPSAGQGAIIDAYKEKFNTEHRHGYNRETQFEDLVSIDCIEIDEKNISALHGKNYNLVWDDFLTFQPVRFYEVIMMNPPFANGAEHLLKAISIQERMGGQVVCILNAETLKNPYSQNRKELIQLLEKYNADIEYMKNEFSNAENKTDVEITLIHIEVKMSNKSTMFEREFSRTQNIDFNQTVNNRFEVAENMSKVQKLVYECEMIKKSTIKLYEEQSKIQKMISDFGMRDSVSVAYGEHTPKAMNVNQFIDEINLRYWHKFIDETDIKNKVPAKLRDHFNYNMDRQRNIEFNIENVRYFSAELMKSFPRAYEETVAELFDQLTRKYHYSDAQWSQTVHLYNGWKSNSAFKVNKKVIIPVSYWDYGLPHVLRDLNLVFENLSGIKDDITRDEYLKEGIKEHDKKLETEFFIIDSYKKGTLHIHFKDEILLNRFNIIASKGKKWLPMDFGEKPYSNMNEEEKRLCKEFGLSQAEYTSIASSGKEYLKLM